MGIPPSVGHRSFVGLFGAIDFGKSFVLLARTSGSGGEADVR
jgi:hypothetical protein